MRSVAATSACNAWAVGNYDNGTAGRTLIERWNGTAWKVMKSPNRGVSVNGNALYGVAATSATNAWAVGSYFNGIAGRTLILHWNGTAWKVMKSPNRGVSTTYNQLYGVTATSPDDVWAVGRDITGGVEQTLILHWNGKAWKVIQSPNPGGSMHFNQLHGVAATSSHNAWAVGSYYDGTAVHTLIEHWNGKAWKVRQSPSPAGQPALQGVASVSSRDAWAVGYDITGGVYQTLTLHWNGKAWKIKQSPNPGGSASSNLLNGVAATSSRSARAVGTYRNTTTFRTLIARWNGKAWKQQQSPNRGGPASYNELDGVAATSATNAWAVGYYSNDTADRTLIERWNGTAWKG